MVSKEATLDVVSDVIDTVDETVDTLERIPHLALNGTTRKQQVVILTAVALGAGGVGAAVSHLVTKKVLRKQFEALLEYQMEETRKHYTVLAEKPSLAELASKIGEEAEQRSDFSELISGYGGQQAPTVVEAEDGTLAPVTQNVFETTAAVNRWNQTVEESKRDEDHPFVISLDEYNQGELDYTQSVLTYYAGDDVLAELDDTAIPTHMVDATVGEGNLLQFGHGSGDPHIVYVRNPRLEIDYEITRSDGKYSQEVAAADFDDEELQARSRRR